MSVQPIDLSTKCRMCGLEKPLVKAHVKPEAFFRPLRTGQEGPKIFSPGTAPPKKAPIGIYDEKILCKDCEKKFDGVDSYGTSVLLSNFDQHFTLVEHSQGVFAFESSSVDQVRLLRFLVAVLWRASVSTHPFYQAVALGPLEATAAETVEHPEKAVPSVFSALLARWMTTPELEDASRAIGSPSTQEIDDETVYRLRLGQVVALVRASKRPFKDSRARLQVGAQAKLYVIGPPFDQSGDLKSMIDTAKASAAAYPQREPRK